MCCYSGCFEDFYLPLVFRSLCCVLGKEFFGFILLGLGSASWICRYGWLTNDPPPKDIHVKCLEPVNIITLFRKGVFEDVIKLKVLRGRVIILRRSLNPYRISIRYPRVKRGDDRHTGNTQRGEGNVALEAQTGMMQAQAKELWLLPEAGRNKECILS